LFINSEADIQKNTLQVKVAITDPPPVFKPEMLVDVTFLAPQLAADAAAATRQSEEVKLYILSQLIHQDAQGPYVWVADQSHRVARKTRVQTGARGANGLIAITAGLNSSSRIIASGLQSLRDGDRIEISGEAASPGPVPSTARAADADTVNRSPAGVEQ
jgi:multidrug efflux pump subunit AcrA (membrane-fusion protein)